MTAHSLALSPSADPDDLSARKAVLVLLILYLISVLSRFALGHLVGAPYIFDDEWSYVELARSIWRGDGTMRGNVHVNFPCWNYPLMIAPIIAWLPIEQALESIAFMNALAISTAIPITYGFARELTTRRRSLAAALLVALLPSFGYTPSVMIENIYLPVFTLSLWLAYRAINRPTAWNALATGALFGLAFHIKPQGLFLPVIFALSALITSMLNLRNLEPDQKKVVYLFKSLAPYSLTLVAWLIVLLPRFWILARFENVPNPFNMNAFLGRYQDMARGSMAPVKSHDLLKSAVCYPLIWILGTGILPAIALACSAWAVLQNRADRKTLIATTLAATTAVLIIVCLLAMVGGRRVHERYYFITYPMVLILFCASERVGFTPNERWLPRIARAATVAILLFLSYRVAAVVHWFVATDTPTISGWLLVFHPHHATRLASIVLVLLLALFAGLFISFVQSFRLNFFAVAILLLAFNFGWYTAHHLIVVRETDSPRKLGLQIARHVKKNAWVLVLKDGLEPDIVSRTGIFNPGATVHMKAEPKFWYSSPLNLGKDGEINSGNSEKDNWILAAKEWKFSELPALEFEDCALYHLNGDRKLRLLNPDSIAMNGP